MPDRPSIGELVELRIEKLVAGGEGLGRLDGIVVFVRGAFPGDLVRAKVTESRKRFVRGYVEELLEPGVDRRESPCPIAATCGGCDWTSYRLDAQLRAKKEILTDSILRIGGIPADTIPEIAVHASSLNYRLRSRLHFAPDGTPGFFAFRTHQVVPIVPECEVVGPQLAARIARREITGEPGSEAIFIEHDSQFSSVTLPIGDDEPTRTIDARGFRFQIGATSFFQVNRHLIGTLIDLVTGHGRMARARDRALDLYGGVGFFALPLSSIYTEVVSVESDVSAHRLAIQNAAGRSVTAIHSDVLRFLRGEQERPDLIVLDPPRSGAHPEVISAIDRLDPDVVSYLSCDPVNLARDLGRFRELGWSARSIDLIDLFPNTHHVETLVSLQRA